VSAVAELRAEVEQLRAELAELRAELAREVRTERLTVVHPVDGRPLVFTDRLDDSVTFHVRWSDHDEQPAVELTSGVEDGGEASLGVVSHGLVVGALEVAPVELVAGVRRRQPSLRLDPAGPAARLGEVETVQVDGIHGVTRRRFGDITQTVEFQLHAAAHLSAVAASFNGTTDPWQPVPGHPLLEAPAAHPSRLQSIIDETRATTDATLARLDQLMGRIGDNERTGATGEVGGWQFDGPDTGGGS
jgi:hypothetical protein